MVASCFLQRLSIRQRMLLLLLLADWLAGWFAADQIQISPLRSPQSLCTHTTGQPIERRSGRPVSQSVVGAVARASFMGVAASNTLLNCAPHPAVSLAAATTTTTTLLHCTRGVAFFEPGPSPVPEAAKTPAQCPQPVRVYALLLRGSREPMQLPNGRNALACSNKWMDGRTNRRTDTQMKQ